MPLVTKPAERVLDGINVVLAALLFISPWVLSYANQGLAAWNAWIGGIVVAILAIAALVRFAEWEEWINAVLGVWLIVAPWALGFSAVAAATWSHVILGVAIAALAAWRAWSAHHGDGQRRAAA
jgi:SPW repeat